MRRLLPLLLLFVLGCEGECPSSQSLVVAGEDYCGDPCERCADCGAGFSCQRRAGRGVCVDEAFLTERGVSTACSDPCPTGEAAFDDEGAEVCARICTVDGECPTCCFEPDALEFMICAPRPELCE